MNPGSRFQSFKDADQEAREGAQIMALAMIEKKSAKEMKRLHPNLAKSVDAYFPDGLFDGKTLDFWRQLNDINFAKYWTKCNAMCSPCAVPPTSSPTTRTTS